ncbi:class I SAM-dependent methyltransferase family protein [Micromonospora inaquosa]|uniref:class I SAM-dependent methyltransferase family protein n=1 Tax=Micromonospora inaquosa TaxID=2203716 RepID=UPI001FC9F6D0|nr:class I SAM-dependent methyltransferase family protein [Micromonospora inaquosa]
MTATSDWHEWHLPYEDDTSPLSRRLRLIQQHINDWLDQRPDSSLRVVSVCAGQGHDLIGALALRSDADRVRAELIEYDPRNVTAARMAVAAAGLNGITATQADAGDFAAYRTAAPADLVLLAGVLGNISDGDVRATINALPRLCASDATVIWTRTRRDPDLTPAIRGWFAGSGFTEEAFHAPGDVLFSVGVHRFHGQPQQAPPSGAIFTFTTGGASRR